MKQVVFSLFMVAALALTGCFGSSSSSSSSSDDSGAANVAGQWRLFMTLEGAPETPLGDLVLRQNGSNVEGNFGPDPIVGTVTGDRFRCTIVDSAEADISLDLDMRVDGAQMTGTMQFFGTNVPELANPLPARMQRL